MPTAEPGDLLKVEFLNMGPLPGDEWGFTGTFHKDNGGGFLTDHYPQATSLYHTTTMLCHTIPYHTILTILMVYTHSTIHTILNGGSSSPATAPAGDQGVLGL